MKGASKSTTAGFTLVEMAIATTILLLIAGSLVTALDGLTGITVTGSTESKLQAAGEHAMSMIIADIQRSSGPVVLNGKTYPFLFENGDASQNWAQTPVAGFDPHTHPPAASQAQPGDPDFGPDREMVFLQPADADNDGRPDIDPNGQLVWDPTEFSYVVVTGALDGRNYLQRRRDGAGPRTAASGVERIVFDDAASSGFTIPLDSIRVQLFLREVDQERRVHRYTAQAVVRMRN